VSEPQTTLVQDDPREAAARRAIDSGEWQTARDLYASVAYEALSNHTRDHREAVAALREKRKPVFTGK